MAIAPVLGARAESQEAEAAFAWTAETLEMASTLPVQHGGRVKPLGTFAGFQLLRMNGKRTLMTPEGERIGPEAWILDCLFRPETARAYECFRIQNDEVVISMGVRDEAKRKSDFYSWYQLRPGLERLFAQADAAHALERSERSLGQTQALELATNVRDFERLCSTLEFARTSLPLTASPGLVRIFGDDPRSGALVLLESAAELRELWVSLDQLPEPERRVEEIAATELSTRIDSLLAPAQHTLVIFAPPRAAPADSEWLGIGECVMRAFAGEAAGLECLPALAALEDLTGLHGDAEGFEERFASLHSELVARAAVRGEYGRVPLEVRFYRGDFFYRALLCFLVGFLLCCVSWMAPKSAWVVRGVWASLLGGTGLLVLGIVLRCIIRARPPVSTLYETILFITAVGVIVSIAIEAMNRRRIAVVVATVLGAGGMFLSMKYELKEAASAGDTMPSLVAVLDTNFWLATHVTVVTMGYAAGLLGSALAHVWLVGRMLGIRGEDGEGYKSLSRMVYGVICFGLLFSVVGTILGGIWANYSWGRFWGWDPKENGALLICIWEILILHARMGGYVRDFGMCVMAVVGGGVVVFSWWGVNLLGVGLHSYGFTSGIWMILASVYGVEALLLLLAGAWRMWSPKARPLG
jgi:ABC-type transport system involved in cytochrome c biogenesis permease subunit